MLISFDLERPLNDAEKAVIRALAGLDTASPATVSTEIHVHPEAAISALNAQAAARPEGLGPRLQKAAQEARERRDTVESATEEVKATAEAAEESVSELREALNARAKALLDAGNKRAVLDALRLANARKVHTVPDEKVAEVLAALPEPEDEALEPEEGQTRTDEPEDDSEAVTDAEEPDEDDAEPEDVDDVTADEEEPEEDDADKAILAEAYEAARDALDHQRRADVVAALGKVGARKVTSLTADQAAKFIAILKKG